MRKVETAHGRRGQHGERIGEDHAGVPVGRQQLEERTLLGVVRTGGIARRRADALVFLGDELGVGERFAGNIAPQLRAHAIVEMLRERLGKPVRDRLQHDRAVVVVLRFHLLHARFDADAAGHGEGSYVIAHARILGRDEVREALVRVA